MNRIFYAVLAIFLSSCASTPQPRVHQEHLDAWRNMPKEALETHTWFLTRPNVRTKTEGGIEIWHYVDGATASNCRSQQSGHLKNSPFLPSVQYNEFTNCISGIVACNSIFFIKSDVIQEWAVTGSCMTSDVHLPQDRYLRLKGN